MTCVLGSLIVSQSSRWLRQRRKYNNMSCYYQYSFRDREDPDAQAKMKEYWDGGVRGYGWAVWKCKCNHCQKEFYAKTPLAKWCSCRCENDAYFLSQKQRREKARHKVCL